MIFYFIQIIGQIASQCTNSGLSICVTFQGDQNFTIDLSNLQGYNFGFWTQYASMSNNYEINYNLFEFEQNGYTIMRLVDSSSKKLKLFYYQPWVQQDTSAQKNLILHDTQIIQVLNLQFDALKYEGMWVYHLFNFIFPNTLQVIVYDLENLFLQTSVLEDLYSEKVEVNLGGLYQFSNGASLQQLAYFIGRISTLQIQYIKIFYTQESFLVYFTKIIKPIPSCEYQIFTTTEIIDYEYQEGLILMESWVKIDYISTLNVTASIFGVEVILGMFGNIYQKLIDIEYCVIQDAFYDSVNGIYFQTLQRTAKDFRHAQRQFLNDTNKDVVFKTIEQNLKEWHYVQLLFGFNHDQPIQNLKMWFLDGSTYESNLDFDIYRFYRNLTIRAGKKFKNSQDGVTVYSGLSKIHVCMPNLVELTKKCYHSCSDCDGPTSSDCLSCTNNRYLENRQCKCNFGFIESNEGICMVFQSLYPNSEQKFIIIDQNQIDFGKFPINQTYINCPKYPSSDFNLYCVECLTDPEGFSSSFICKSDYLLNQYGQYQIQMRDQRDIELYIADNNLLQINLCKGCKQQCDPSLDSYCYFNNNHQIYVQCSVGYYQDLGECKTCLNDCLTCDNAATCTLCNTNLIKNPLTGLCIGCQLNCEECYFDVSNNLLCSKCIEKYALYAGKCLACGLYCAACQYTLDVSTNSYYNKCLYCIDSSLYYLELNGVSCAENTITNCQYVIQFHRSWYLRSNINTILYNFQGRNISQSDLITYCGLCDEGYAATMYQQCIPIYYIDASGICTMMFQIEDWQSGIYIIYNYYCQMYNTQPSQDLNLISTKCWYYIRNCYTCYQTMCLKCFYGYYENILTGNCNPCPSDLKCRKCQHQSKQYKNGWKIWYKLIYELITTESFYSDVFGNEDEDKLEVICLECNPGYELYNGRCIIQCAANCNTCIKINNENYCVECKIYNGKLLSLQDGQCIECPRYCSLCQPKLNNQIIQANPYFNNQAQIQTTHTCLLLDKDLDPHQYAYNYNFKQFFKYSVDEIDPNQVIMEFNLYCDINQFQFDLQNSINQQMFLSQNVRFDEIFTNTQGNFDRIENEYFYSYLGSQQIQEVEFTFKLLSDCIISQKSVLFTTLTKNVYFLNQAIITILGNQHNLILQSQLDILGFDRIELSDLNIQIIGQDFNLNFSSENSLEIIFNQVDISSKLETNFYIQMTNIKSLTINKLSIQDSKIENVISFFKLNQAKSFINISVLNMNINNSNIQNSNLFYFDQPSIISCQMNKFQIISSNFTKSAILISRQKYSFIITNLTMESVYFIDSAPIFTTYLLDKFQFDQGYILKSVFKNSIVFQVSQQTSISHFSFIDNILINSSVLFQNISYALDSLNIYLEVFVIQNVTYDKVHSILYASSDLKNSMIHLNNWIMNQLISNNDSSLNIYSVQPLLFCQSDKIIFYQIELARGRGITEFYLSLASEISISNVVMNNFNFFQTLISNQECKQDFSYFQYQTVIYIEKVQNIQLRNLTINSLIIFNVPLIYISSISTYITKRQESLIMDTLIVNGCILQQIQSINLIALIYLISEQQMNISMTNSEFKNNLYYTTESEQNSALTINMNVQNGQIEIQNCVFQENYISQSQIGLLNLDAESINIDNSSFIRNNRFSKDLLKHISWGYSERNITLQYLSNYFPVISQNGNGKLSADKISLNKVIVNGSTAQQAGCFYITLQNKGAFVLSDSQFSEIETKNNGGCFYIDDKTTQLSLQIQSSKFDSIFTQGEGGGIYLLPGSQIIQINITNTSIINTFALQGAFIKLSFSNYLTQAIYLENCNILYSIDGVARFMQTLTNIDQIQSSQLANGTAVIVIQQGILSFRNIVSQLYIFGLLETTYSNKISLTSVVVENSFYGSRPAIRISCNQDENCKVNFNNLYIKGFVFYNNPEYQLQIFQKQVLSSKSQCQSSILPVEPINEVNSIDFSLFGKDTISSIVQIINIKSNDQITLKNSYMTSNMCQDCQNGLFELLFLQEIGSNKNFIFSNIQITDNNCGRQGCLTFTLNVNSRILTEIQNQIQISHLICNKNKAVNGSCIYSSGIGLIISESIINENTATNFGGGIYFSGDVKTLLIYNNLITSNIAEAGSAIYIDQNSSPELNKTNNYLDQESQTVSSFPTSLTITLDNYKNLLLNSHKEINEGFIQISDNPATITLPSGQEISKYRYFNLSNQEYQSLDLTLRIVPLNNFNERQFNLTNSICKIISGYYQNDTLIITNNFTSFNQKIFNLTTQDYNFDDLVLYYGANNSKGQLILLFECNSVNIPIYDTVFPYKILNYISNYKLQLNVQTFNCQLGEFKNPIDESCYICDASKKLYSVTEGATLCNYMDEDSMISITSAQIQLKNGFWRPSISNGIVEKCINRLENCLGGWKQGDQTCLKGQLGARCESCDTYNIRGQGEFNKKQLYICEECDQQRNQIFYIIAVSLWMLISLFLTTRGIQNMVSELQKNRIGQRQLLINNNKQTGPIIKMFTNYLQNIAIILNFNIEIPNTFKNYFTLFGNSQQLLLISTDCFFAQYFQENIMYIKILQCLINPLIYGILFTLIYIIYLYFNKGYFEKIVITTSVLYLFCYFQPQAIQQLISTLSYQHLSGIDWIQANLAYKFYTDEHLKWIPYLVSLAILLGIIVPAYLIVKLIYHKKKLYIIQLRKNWGYLFLEYQPNAYYWEFIRILIRESMILAVTFYQDSIFVKCFLVFIIFFLYQQATHFVSPYKTSKLNQLDDIYSQICNFTIICMLTLTVIEGFYSLFVILIIVPNIYLFCSFSTQLVSGYLQAYEESLDKIKDSIRSKFPKFIEKVPFLKKFLVNKSQQRKKIIAKFKMIKKHLFYSVAESASKAQKFTIQTASTSHIPSTLRSGLTSPREATHPFLIPQIILSTNENQEQNQKRAFIK